MSVSSTNEHITPQINSWLFHLPQRDELIGKQYEEETHILARVRLNQLRVNRQQSGTAFHKRAEAASATNSVSLGCDCRAMELWRGPRENRRDHGWSIHRTDATRSRPGQRRCHRRAPLFARRKRGNRAGAASASPNGAAMISQYFIESLPSSSRDEFPTLRNLSVSVSGLNDPLAHVQCRRMPCQ